jgi:hypothetical protein
MSGVKPRTGRVIISRGAGVTITAAVVVALTAPIVAQLAPLADGQIDAAIALGKKGDVPVALVGRMFGISKADFRRDPSGIDCDGRHQDTLFPGAIDSVFIE